MPLRSSKKTASSSPGDKNTANIFSLALRSRGVWLVLCCCCLIFTLQFAVIGAFVLHEHNLLSGHGLYYTNAMPQTKKRRPVSSSNVGFPHKLAPESSGSHFPNELDNSDLLEYSLADFEKQEHKYQKNHGIVLNMNGDGEEEICGPLLLGVNAHHDYTCQTILSRCCCQSASHQGVWTSPTVSILGAQKGGSTALLAYMMHVDGYRNAKAKELHFFDRNEVMHEIGIPGFFHFFDPSSPESFMQEQVGWTTPSLLYALPAPANVAKIVPHAKFIIVLRNPIDRAMSEYYMEQRRVDKQNQFLEKFLPHLPELSKCHGNRKDGDRRLRRRGPPSAGGPVSDCLKGLPLYDNDGFHTFLLQNVLDHNLLPNVMKCIEGVRHIDLTDTSNLKIGQQGYTDAKRCFAERGHAFIEELKSIKEQFEDEMKMLDSCTKINNEGHKILKIGKKGCFPQGATSNLMEGNFLLRSMYSQQVRHWFQSFDKNQFLFVLNKDLHKNPQAVVDQVTKFLGLPRTKIDPNIDMHEFINKEFPGFEEATGWSMAAQYPDLDEDLRKKMPFTDDLTELIGWDNIEWI